MIVTVDLKDVISLVFYAIIAIVFFVWLIGMAIVSWWEDR